MIVEVEVKPFGPKAWVIAVRFPDIALSLETDTFGTQDTAIAVARQLYTRFERSELTIKGEDGAIRERDTWPRAADPKATRG